MIEYYETVEGCPRQPVQQQVLVSVPVLQLSGMQLSNVCASKLKYWLPHEKNWRSEVLGTKIKKLSNWLRSQLWSWAHPAWGSCWSIALHSYLFHLEFQYFFNT